MSEVKNIANTRRKRASAFLTSETSNGAIARSHAHPHASHPDIVKRLKRAEGHLRSLIAMIEDERPCLHLAQQLHAVEHAVSNAKRELIRDHIDHCLEDVVGAGGKGAKSALEEFKQLSKYL